MSISVLNTDANLSGATLLTAEGVTTQIGLITFDRDPNPPFAVSAASAVVPNLDADKIDGYEATQLAVLAETETVSGTWTFTPGVKFSGSGTVSAGPAAGGNANLLRLVGGTSGTDVVNQAVTTQLVTISDAGDVAVPTGSLTVSDGIVNQGYLSAGGQATPTQLTGNVNDWNPTGLFTATILRASSDASRTVTGIVAASSRMILISNVGAQNIVFEHNSASSSANNRVFGPGAGNYTLNAQDSVWAYYDNTELKWRLVDA